MPRFDGTGPRGRGAGTGRGRGGCSIFATLCDGRRPPGKAFFSLAATVAGIMVKDAMNPDGITRKAFRILGNRVAGRVEESNTGSARKVRTVEAEVLPGPEKSK